MSFIIHQIESEDSQSFFAHFSSFEFVGDKSLFPYFMQHSIFNGLRKFLAGHRKEDVIGVSGIFSSNSACKLQQSFV